MAARSHLENVCQRLLLPFHANSSAYQYLDTVYYSAGSLVVHLTTFSQILESNMANWEPCYKYLLLLNIEIYCSDQINI